jgi:hypothetical protein
VLFYPAYQCSCIFEKREWADYACDLKRLIAAGAVRAFRRSDKWVKAGSEPVRGDGGQEYDCPEQRNSIRKPISEEQKPAGHYCVLGTR